MRTRSIGGREVSAIGLTDCDGNAWTLDGVALETQLPPLPRFPVEVVAGSVTVDFTRTLTDTP